MDIKLCINLNVQQLIAAANTPLLNLKLNQQIEATLVNTDLIKNTIALTIGENTLQLQANQPLTPQIQLHPGTTLTLQVIRLTPQPEFKLLATLPNLPSVSNLASASPPSVTVQIATAQLSANPVVSASVEPSHKTHSNPSVVPAPPSATANNLPDTPAAELQFKLLTVPAKPTVTPTNQTAIATNTPDTPSATTNLGTAVSKTVVSNPANLPPSAQLTTNNSAQAGTSFVISDENSVFSNAQQMTVKIVGLNEKTIQLQIPTTPTNTDRPATFTTPATAATSTANAPTAVAPSTIVVSIPLKDLKIWLPAANQAEQSTVSSHLNPGITQASSAPLLKIGDSIQLTVIPTPAKTEFTIQPGTNNLQQAQHINTALREQLPKQASPIHLLNQLMEQLPELQQNRSVSETLKHIAQKILQTLPDAQQLTDPVILKKIIRNTGIFLEAKLAQPATDIAPDLSNDFKANLLKLHATLKESPAPGNINEELTTKAEAFPELQQKTEHSLAKLVLDQLASLPKDDNPKQQWHLEIPYAHNEQLTKLDMTIERDGQHASSAEQHAAANWSVTLSITPPGLDTIHCKIVFDNDTISTYFRSENSLTCERIKENVDHLRTQFEANGLKPGHMDAHTGNFQQNIQDKIKQQNLFYGKA